MPKLYKENKVFKKYGHKCELAEELDYVLQLVPGDTMGATIKRFCYRNITVNPCHPKAKIYLRSQMCVTENMKIHLQNPTIIHPFSNFRLFWEFIMIFGTFVVAIAQPMQAASYLFPDRDLGNHDLIYNCIMGSIFSLNILVEFRTGFWSQEKNTVILEGSQVALHYLITFFSVDFIIVLPAIYIPDGSSPMRSLQMGLLLVKIITAARVVDAISKLMTYLQKFNVAYTHRRIMEMILYCFLYLHWHSCYNMFLINLQFIDAAIIPQVETWASGESKSFWVALADAFFSCTLVLTTANISTMNRLSEQYILDMIFWFSGKAVFIFVITSMMLAVKCNRIALSKNTEMFWHLEVYMLSKDMPIYLRNRLMVYYEFRYQKSYFRESEIMNKVSGQLKQDMIMHNCRTLLENVSFFKKMPLNFLARIIICMVEEVYLTNDVIVKVNTTPRCMYFIASGTVAVYTSSGEEICHLTEGEHFGEVGLVVPSLKRTASVLAVEICELFRLDSKDFMKAVSPFPDLLAQVEAIAQSRLENTRILEDRETETQPRGHTSF